MLTVVTGCRAEAPAKPVELPPPVLAKDKPTDLKDKTALNLSAQYAQTLWPTGHRDASNTDYVPMVLGTPVAVEHTALHGHPIFWPPAIAPDGTLYVTTGKGPGESHLFALDAQGKIKWSAKPQTSTSDLDSYAIINAPVIDSQGDIYVGDKDQLWAFKPDSTVKWVIDLTQYGVDWGFVTVVLNARGEVGGVTTNGKVIFVSRTDGALAHPVLDLPGGDGPPAQDTPPPDLWKDLMDPEIKPFMFNLIQGWQMEVANTPALHPMTGRMYITAAGVKAGTGTLYGIDATDDGLKIAFQAPMGGGSGTSPAVSHDGARVYALDENGVMVAVDAQTGARVWQSEGGGGGSASPSVAADETVYTANQDRMTAFSADGKTRWSRSYTALCESQLDEPGGVWNWLLRKPVAFIDSIITVGTDTGWINIVCGNEFRFVPARNERTRVPIPRLSLVVTFSLADGSLVGDPLPIPETSEGFITPLGEGRAVVTSSGAITSIFYYMANRILPDRLKVEGPPKAGLVFLSTATGRRLPE